MTNEVRFKLTTGEIVDSLEDGDYWTFPVISLDDQRCSITFCRRRDGLMTYQLGGIFDRQTGQITWKREPSILESIAAAGANFHMSHPEIFADIADRKTFYQECLALFSSRIQSVVIL